MREGGDPEEASSERWRGSGFEIQAFGVLGIRDSGVWDSDGWEYQNLVWEYEILVFGIPTVGNTRISFGNTRFWGLGFRRLGIQESRLGIRDSGVWDSDVATACHVRSHMQFVSSTQWYKI
jgi:hypothetical protein